MRVISTNRIASLTTALILVGALLAAPARVNAGGTGTAANDPTQISRGDSLYRQFCQRCHGASLRSSGASTFDLRQFPPTEHDRFIESVTEGSGDMPPHGDILESNEIEALFAYVIATQNGQTP